jgi:hypothetical protein
MNPIIAHLVELQSLDSRLIEVRAALAEFPKQIAAVNARLEAARAALQKSRDELTRSLKERKSFEIDVEQWKEKARKYRDQVYQVKSNEAYKALQHEIQTAEQEMARAEDRLLERMVAGEEFERQVKAAEQALAATERDAAAELSRLEAERARIQAELASDEEIRNRDAAEVPEELVQHYTRLARRHNGVAVAPVHEDETCSICRVRVRPHVFQQLCDPASSEIIHCESCTRILYVPDEVISAIAAARNAASKGAAEEIPQGHDA